MEIAKDFRFEAAHRLPNVPEDHKCHRLHGHSFRVTLVVGGPMDPQLGWLVDFADIERAWKPLHAIVDHHYLNEIEGLENPTSEVLAQWVASRLELPEGIHLVSVTIQETCVSRCTLYPEHSTS